MKYEKPEITPLADAAMVIQGTKAVGMWDNVDPTNPVRSISAYESDE